jgi:hypothetical protein
LNRYTLTNPEIFISLAEKKFNEQGNLTDPQAIELLKKLLENLVYSCKTQKIPTF